MRVLGVPCARAAAIERLAVPPQKAEFERAINRERVRAGQGAGTGPRQGRRPVAQAHARHRRPSHSKSDFGESTASEMARLFGVHKSGICQLLQRHSP